MSRRNAAARPFRPFSVCLALWLISSAAAEPPVYLQATNPDRSEQIKSDRWIDTIASAVPPLNHRRGGRLPMIMWHGVGFNAMTEAEIGILADRGLCQHLQLSETMIPTAVALQKAGMPVILMEGRTDHWPYSLAEPPDQWAHDLDVSFPRPWFGNDDAFEWHGACPHLTSGWSVMEKEMVTLLEKFREAGVTVDGVWTDFEGDPYPWRHLYEQIRNCRRCREHLPPAIVNDRKRWWDDSWQRYVRLYDRHLAKAVKDVFPEAVVTNWHVVRSTADHPIRYFVRDEFLPKLDFEFFNATNPIAYASDAAWNARMGGVGEITGESADRFFMHEILQQVSTDGKNRRGSQIGCVPWVARVCKLEQDPQNPAPIMSRSMYRESLRHLWLRGIDTMQIFNPMITGHEQVSVEEIQDAVAIYDEMLAEWPRKDLPEVMNWEVPDDRSQAVLWSGLRGQSEAVVRVVHLGSGEAEISIECWPGQFESFGASPEGKTHRVRRRNRPPVASEPVPGP